MTPTTCQKKRITPNSTLNVMLLSCEAARVFWGGVGGAVDDRGKETGRKLWEGGGHQRTTRNSMRSKNSASPSSLNCARTP